MFFFFFFFICEATCYRFRFFFLINKLNWKCEINEMYELVGCTQSLMALFIEKAYSWSPSGNKHLGLFTSIAVAKLFE